MNTMTRAYLYWKGHVVGEIHLTTTMNHLTGSWKDLVRSYCTLASHGLIAWLMGL